MQLLSRSMPGAAAALPAAAVTAAAPGMLGIARTIVREEGAAALYKGFWPAMHRQLLFASLRFGLYGQVRRGGHCRLLGMLEATLFFWCECLSSADGGFHFAD